MGQKRKTDPYYRLKEIGQRWLRVISTTLEASTVVNYRTNIFQFIHFLNTYYPKITRFYQLKRSPHIEEWLSNLVRRNLCSKTRRLHIIDIRHFLNDIYEWGWEPPPKEELFNHKDLPPVPEELPRPVSPETDEILKKVLPPMKNIFAQGILLLRLTGMRVGEMRDLELDCLKSLGNNQYLLRIPIGKLHTERVIPVTPEVAHIIQRIIKLRGNCPPIPHPRTKKPTQFLFVRKNGKRPTYTGFREFLGRLSRRYKLKEHVTLHQLRHSYATELLRYGMSLLGLKKLLGHKKITMTLRYTAVTQLDLQRSYYNTIEKVKSGNLIPQPSQLPSKEDVQADNSSYVLDGINNLIVKIENIRRDLTARNKRKKMRRISERLRRAQQDLKKFLNY